jgi:hypothetical protein
MERTDLLMLRCSAKRSLEAQKAEVQDVLLHTLLRRNDGDAVTARCP